MTAIANMGGNFVVALPPSDIWLNDMQAAEFVTAVFKNLEGYVLVPVEPTDAMLIAADNCVISGKVTANNIYKAMLEAARGGNE